MMMSRTPFGMIANFERQFDQEGPDRYLFRQGGSGAPIQVSERERIRFINQFTSKVFLLFALQLTAIGALLLYFVWNAYRTNPSTLPSEVIFSNPLFYVGLAAIGVPSALLYRWFWNTPSRALEGRAAVGAALTPKEHRAASFRQVTYGHLLLVAVIGVGTFGYIRDGYWGRRWVFVSVLLVVVPIVQAVRKWLAERQAR